jgi:hypothetical protein
MTTFVILSNQAAYGPYTNETKLMDDVIELRRRGYTETTFMPMSKIDWNIIEEIEDGSPRTERTREILAELFPIPGTTMRVSEVRSALQEAEEQGEFIVTGSYLTEIRKELSIVSRPVRRRGKPGVSHWEWTREQPATAEKIEAKKEKKRSPKKQKPNEIEYEQVGESRDVWVDVSRLDEYRRDPSNYQGEVLNAAEIDGEGRNDDDNSLESFRDLGMQKRIPGNSRNP